MRRGGCVSSLSSGLLILILETTYLLDADDLTGGLLDLLQAAQEVPVTGLRNRGVGGEDGHAVQGGSRVGLGGQVAPDDLVFRETTWSGNLLAACRPGSKKFLCAKTKIRLHLR